MDKQGWNITVDGHGSIDAMQKFNAELRKHDIPLEGLRRLQRAALELLVDAGNGSAVRIVCSGHRRADKTGYTGLSVSVALGDAKLHDRGVIPPAEAADTNEA